MLESIISSTTRSRQESYGSREVRPALAVTIAACEIAAVAASTYFAFIIYHLIVWGVVPAAIPYGWTCTGLSLMYGLICLADRQYDFLGAEWNQQAFLHRGALALALAFVFLLTFMFMTGMVTVYSRGTLVAQLALGLPVQIAVRVLSWRAVEAARRRGYWTSPGILVLVFPGVEKPMRLLEQLSSRQEEIRRIYYLDPERSDAQLKAIPLESRALQCESVLLLFGSDGMDAVTRAVDTLSEMPIKVQLLPIGLLDLMNCSRIGYYGRGRVFEIASGPDWAMDRLLKRSLDLIVAYIAGLLLLPLMLTVGALIKLDSPGPILFRQVRHGYNNRRINVLKFRTMIADVEKGFRQTTRDDPRVTRLGRILRRTNIDELPQLVNVIRGDMSIIGPRPHAVLHNEMYDGQIARMSRRHNVKPGITGWAQVNGLRGETDTLEKMRARVEHDLYYIDNWSFWFDLKILLMTIFSKKSYENAC